MIIDVARLGSGRVVVEVDGRPLTPKRSQAVWNHSPDGFEVGYGGSGPAQLALAILLEAGVDDERAVTLHEIFKWTFIATRQAPFRLDLDVRTWADAQRQES
jgi:Family of unknown function (DUF6166)